MSIGGDTSIPSGTHGEGPRAAASKIRKLIREAEERRDLPEYIDRLREIEKTMRDRGKADHPQR